VTSPDPSPGRSSPVSSDDRGESVRIDAWAWAVRLYKTRSLAAAACRKEQLLVNGARCRPSRQVRVGDEVSMRQGPLLRRLEVVGILAKRVGAREVPRYLLDRTPPEEVAAAEALASRARRETPRREPGAGRPTKRERRDIEGLLADAAEQKTDFEAFVKALKKPR